MRNNFHKYLFLALVILLSIFTNMYANTTNITHFKQVNTLSKSSYHTKQQLNQTLFKPSTDSKKDLLVIEEIETEEVEESENHVCFYIQKPTFGSNAYAILFKVLIESNTVKTKENLALQRFNTRTTSLSLHKKLEVFIL